MLLRFTFVTKLYYMNPQSFHKFFIFSILLVMSLAKGFSQSATLIVHQDEKINQLLDLKKDLEKNNKLSDGYTIQLYYGELGEANQVLRKYRGSFSSWPASIEYETPNYKVWVGNFTSRLDAERALMAIQQNFSAAFILKPERRK